MKNNKIFNRTFKISLVTAALGLVNSALAADVACNSSGVTITGQSGAVLNQCSINPTSPTNGPEWGSLSAVKMTNSSGQLNNVNASLSIPANRHSSFAVMNITNSTTEINGGIYSITNPNNADSSGYLFELNNSTVTMHNSKVLISDSNQDSILEAFALNQKSKLTLNNVNVTSNNDSSIFVYEAENQARPELIVNNSNVSIPQGGIIALRSGVGEVINSHFSATFNNSTISGFALASAESTKLSDTKSLTENIQLTFNNSTVSGGTTTDSNSVLNLNLNNSNWTTKAFTDEDGVVQTTSLTNLALNNGVVNLANDNYQGIIIRGNLTGSGTFNLNTNIAENKSDKIIVKGTAEGSHKIGVTNQGANVANGKVTLVETNGGNAAFSLTNPNNRVDLGAYQYFLTKEGNNWVLANSKNSVTPTPPVAPVTPSKPVVTPNKPVVTPNKPVATPTTPVLPSTPLLSDLANAQVSLRQAQLLLVEDDLSGIHQRLGEVKNGEKGNVWVRNVNSHQKLAALSTGESETSGFKQNVHSVQVGADAALTDNLRIGGFVGRSQANVDFNGHYGDGKVRSNSVGLYAAYLADNGIYVDNIVKYSRLHANSDLTEKRHYNAYTISSELGKRFSLANDWTITPQAQLAWTHISSQENEDSLSSVYSRIGLRVAKGFALSNGWNLQPYAEVNAITSKNRSSKIHYTNSALDVASSRGRFKSAVGLNAGFANHRFGLEVSRADGKNFDKPYAIQAVYRYQW
ncbi:autotransporter outer membrane beta-barrel domain-containing protein [Haemophilus parainfluenzae]|uniref:autotransporter outer membrane beta-barrel domain-containing protein n=1 Tax=Haemophilus parainfluenzae TaxID=729 RepID=UPI0018A545D6|nr:autotransporter outer membrane beta-barrel domain-containing protein [Haemophilus parainfluenzae]MBF1254346.1 autotransporter outer membrane beta-barrel domain-containing protein [Haemophilus sp.]QOR10453.1 autotransporter outer membrane beta-barrel domain-containing protein [Haemophilus parainfluenzae]